MSKFLASGPKDTISNQFSEDNSGPYKIRLLRDKTLKARYMFFTNS